MQQRRRALGSILVATIVALASSSDAQTSSRSSERLREDPRAYVERKLCEERCGEVCEVPYVDSGTNLRSFNTPCFPAHCADGCGREFSACQDRLSVASKECDHACEKACREGGAPVVGVDWASVVGTPTRWRPSTPGEQILYDLTKKSTADMIVEEIVETAQEVDAMNQQTRELERWAQEEQARQQAERNRQTSRTQPTPSEASPRRPTQEATPPPPSTRGTPDVRSSVEERSRNTSARSESQRCRAASKCLIQRGWVDGGRTNYCKVAGKSGRDLLPQMKNGCSQELTCRVCMKTRSGRFSECKNVWFDPGEGRAGWATDLFWCGGEGLTWKCVVGSTSCLGSWPD